MGGNQFSSPKDHYVYHQFVVLLLKGVHGDTGSYKEFLEKTGILEKAVLVENEKPTLKQVSDAITKVENLITSQWNSLS